jgi:nicotinamidase/pyrazinamidase
LKTGPVYPSTLHRQIHYVTKGVEEQVDSYSAIYNVAGTSETRLPELLKDQGITHVYVVGLALDYCVKFTALDV